MRATKTEIYFGEDEPGRKHVTLLQWRTFLSDVVTPLFPRGMTVVQAYRDRLRNAQVMVVRSPVQADFLAD